MYHLPGEPDCPPDLALKNWAPQPGDQFWCHGIDEWTLYTITIQGGSWGFKDIDGIAYYYATHDGSIITINQNSLLNVLRVPRETSTEDADSKSHVENAASTPERNKCVSAPNLDTLIWPERARSFVELLDPEDYATHMRQHEPQQSCPRCGLGACMHPRKET